MTIRVETWHLDVFTAPQRCVACGNTPAQESITASAVDGKFLVSVKFPLCAECNKVKGIDDDISGSITKGCGWWANLLFSFLLCVLIGSNLQGKIGDLWLGFVVFDFGDILAITIGVASFLLIPRLIYKFEHRKFSPEKYQMENNVKSAARIMSFKKAGFFNKNGALVFQFLNDEYGIEFAQLNSGHISH